MWYLEAWCAKEEKDVREYLLGDIDEQTLKRVLKLSNDEYSDEHFGPFTYEVVKTEGLFLLAGQIEKYSDEAFVVNESLSYYISYFAEEGELGIPVTTVYVPPRFLPATPELDPNQEH